MGISTATIETLTAEVRVLMLGSRQITISVANQLDWRPLERVEPFGRISLKSDDDLIIGRDRLDGSLVLARYERNVQRPMVLKNELEQPLLICRNTTWNGVHQCYVLRWDEVEIGASPGAVTFRCEHHRGGSESCDGYLANGNAERLNEVVRQFRDRHAMHMGAASLPLIVLAGLR